MLAWELERIFKRRPSSLSYQITWQPSPSQYPLECLQSTALFFLFPLRYTLDSSTRTMIPTADLESAIRTAIPITHLEIIDQSNGCGENYAILVVSEVRFLL